MTIPAVSKEKANDNLTIEAVFQNWKIKTISGPTENTLIVLTTEYNSISCATVPLKDSNYYLNLAIKIGTWYRSSY
jgi:hypothetical protein